MKYRKPKKDEEGEMKVFLLLCVLAVGSLAQTGGILLLCSGYGKGDCIDRCNCRWCYKEKGGGKCIQYGERHKCSNHTHETHKCKQQNEGVTIAFMVLGSIVAAVVFLVICGVVCVAALYTCTKVCNSEYESI